MNYQAYLKTNPSKELAATEPPPDFSPGEFSNQPGFSDKYAHKKASLEIS